MPDMDLDESGEVYCDGCNSLIGYANQRSDLSAGGIFCLGCAYVERERRLQPTAPPADFSSAAS
jgi:RNase P subunit RPR2